MKRHQLMNERLKPLELCCGIVECSLSIICTVNNHAPCWTGWKRPTSEHCLWGRCSLLKTFMCNYFTVAV